MRNRVLRSIPALSLAALLVLTGATAQKPASQLAGSRSPAGLVELQPQADVIKGAVAAFPHIVAGPAVTRVVADRINAALERADVLVKESAEACQSSLKRAGRTPDANAWTRTVQVTMRGPRFVSLVARDGYDCGATHPGEDQVALVYDLGTGAAVDWPKLLPPGVKAGTAAASSRMGLVTWPEARRLAIKGADQECTEDWAYYPDMHFSFYLDGAAGELEASPVDFDHAEAFCADDISFTVSELGQMKASPELVDALKASHVAAYNLQH